MLTHHCQHQIDLASVHCSNSCPLHARSVHELINEQVLPQLTCKDQALLGFVHHCQRVALCLRHSLFLPFARHYCVRIRANRLGCSTGGQSVCARRGRKAALASSDHQTGLTHPSTICNAIASHWVVWRSRLSVVHLQMPALNHVSHLFTVSSC